MSSATHQAPRSWDSSLVAYKCVTLAAAVTNLGTKVNLFAAEVRGSKKDMDAVVRELASVSMCLDALEYDQRRRMSLPDNIRDDLGGILNDCEYLVNQISSLLLEFQTRSIGVPDRWNTADQQDLEALRNPLASNRIALDAVLYIGISAVLATRFFRLMEQDSNQIEVGWDGKTPLSTDPNLIVQFDELATYIGDLRTQARELQHASRDKERFQILVNHSKEYVESVMGSLKDHLREFFRCNSVHSVDVQLQLENKISVLETSDFSSLDQGYTGEPSEQNHTDGVAHTESTTASPDYNYLIAHERLEEKYRAERSRRVGLTQELESLQAELLKERGQVECLEEEVQRLQSTNEELAIRAAGEKTGDSDLPLASGKSSNDEESERSFKTQATAGGDPKATYHGSGFTKLLGESLVPLQHSALAALIPQTTSNLGHPSRTSGVRPDQFQGEPSSLSTPMIKFSIRIDWVESPAYIVSVQAEAFYFSSLLRRSSQKPTISRNELIDLLCKIASKDHDFGVPDDYGVTTCKTIIQLRKHLCSISEACLSALKHSENCTLLQVAMSSLDDTDSIQVLATHGQDKSTDVWLSLLPMTRYDALQSLLTPISDGLRPLIWTDPDRWLSSLSFDVIRLYVASRGDKSRTTPTNRKSKARWTQFALRRISKDYAEDDHNLDQLPPELLDLAPSYSGLLSSNLGA